ncbi:MAG: glycosyltransferase [Clostridia bacterium]|nr:glycosyltransferase [Clostridia bacterium]
MKLLTVTVPCYNSAGYMRACVDSLLQGGERVEIVIIDDGSTDDTGRIADEYAAAYPSIVKVVHQENGGHGEGINQGLQRATGRYFKVVDSDDCVSADFPQFLDRLSECERHGGVDLFVTNYYYVHADGIGDRAINYSNALPEGRIFKWEQTKRFRVEQLLTIHSCTFRTENMRESGLDLPKHTFYEDNLMVYASLVNTERLYYYNSDLYRYTIGREGQSVQEDVMKRRYMHQIRVTEQCFTTARLDEIDRPMLKAYMKHELFIMLGISTLYARLNDTPEAEKNLQEMWKRCRAFDEKWGRYFRYHSPLFFVNISGKIGQKFAVFIYRLANKVVRFN